MLLEQTTEPRNKTVLTPPMVDSCDVESRSGKVIPEYSLRERALCAYHHVLNYNSQVGKLTLISEELGILANSEFNNRSGVLL